MQSKPIALTILDILSVIALGVATYFALVFAPTEAVMGNVQRVFYFHVGSAWVGLVGFVLAAISGIAYLITKDMRWDRFEVAAVEVSTMFFFITIVLGSIWARPAWNTWWTWDPRLTTAAVTELILSLIHIWALKPPMTALPSLPPKMDSPYRPVKHRMG